MKTHPFALDVWLNGKEDGLVTRSHKGRRTSRANGDGGNNRGNVALFESNGVPDGLIDICVLGEGGRWSWGTEHFFDASLRLGGWRFRKRDDDGLGDIFGEVFADEVWRCIEV